MTARQVAEPGSTPSLASHVRLRHDRVRGAWTLQAPERVFMLDEAAHAIVSRCDGAASIVAIVDDLMRNFVGASRQAIEGDVIALVQDFTDKGVMVL